MSDLFSKPLLAWYDECGRKNLPWQQNITPYHVWLSEIMLQQTQVNTVIPYYTRFIDQYNDITSLATAKLDDVLALWTGLGYYSRARNLHKAAVIMHEQHQDQMPTKFEDLIALPGIGRSTAGAIMTLAHQQRFAILDGNVKRVLARYGAIEGWPGKKNVEQQLWQLAEQLLPSKRIANYIQAQMDLGATVCTRTKPLCQQCPLQQNCQAFQLGNPQDFPSSKPKKVSPVRNTNWLIAQNETGEILLEQRPNLGIWGGLWSFPEIEDAKKLDEHCQNKLNIQTLSIDKKNPIHHIFSHFKLTINPYLIQCSYNSRQIADNKLLGWYTISDALRLGLPAPVKAFITLLE